MVYTLIFIAITAASSKATSGIVTTDLVLPTYSFQQWVIGLLALMFGVICGFFYAWFSYFRQMKYTLDWKLLAGFGVIEGASIALAFVF